MTSTAAGDGALNVAIVGMSCRVPGSTNVAGFWDNLCRGVESISRFTPQQLRSAGVDEGAVADPRFVAAGGVLDGVENFDPTVFGMTPLEATIADPQHRILLECAMQALEDAGHDPTQDEGRVGVFAGAGRNRYLGMLLRDPELASTVGQLPLIMNNDAYALTTRISYLLDLTGPSMSVHTACSTSLVAVHLACQSLLSGECDTALAGGVTIHLPQTSGYRYEEGGIESPDGHCRPFDARAAGTVFGNGAGIVALRRLEDALRDGDRVRAVVRGTAVNNDGAGKLGFTAPSIAGQAAVIEEALLVGAVEPETVGYVEAHGTATPLGDPIEIAALTQAFRTGTDARGTCSVGSVKSNVGHLDTAAGIVGLIKAAITVERGAIPASLHYEVPNPEIDFDASPFIVSTALHPWPSRRWPRRAGISSFGLGGTNTHVVIEQAPSRGQARSRAGVHLVTWSAATEHARTLLDGEVADRARTETGEDGRTALADAAFTSQVGRHARPYRRAAVCRSWEELASLLSGEDGGRTGPLLSGEVCGQPPEVVLLFPGQGAEYEGMARGLYGTEPLFRETVDAALSLGEEVLQAPLRDPLFGTGTGEAPHDGKRALERPAVVQVALFAVEYAIAKLWEARGVRPAAMIGHSLGEYVAACLAGVFSFEDAVTLVARRGLLADALPVSRMLAVAASESKVRPLLKGRVDVAAINAPERCVVSGEREAVEDLRERLEERGIVARPTPARRGFHSPLCDDALDAFAHALKDISLRPPTLPYVSCLTGAWARPEAVTEPGYWVRHLREPVRFAEALQVLAERGPLHFLEVGPGRALSSLARRQFPGGAARAVGTLPDLGADEVVAQLSAAGSLWVSGVPIRWAALHDGEPRIRVPLPGHPLERVRCWVCDAGPPTVDGGAGRPPAPPDASPVVAAGGPEAAATAVVHAQLDLMERQLRLLRAADSDATDGAQA